MSEYEIIAKLVQNEQYRARLFNMFPVEDDKVQIKIYKIKNKGSKGFDTFLESTLRPITVAEPANSFEKGILDAFNECRSNALKKYFPVLSDDIIKILLNDNYLQKKDLKKFFL